MKQVVATVIRDMLNLFIYAGVLITVTVWIYGAQPDLEPLKNVLLPMKGAIMICIFASIIFVVINRVTTLLAVKLMRR